MSQPDLSIVAPCYNEEAGITELHRRISAVCANIGKTYEIVLVNDGSRDGTWEQLRVLAGKDPNIVAVNLSRNHGHQLALTAGLSVCRGHRVLIIDADLQDPPELLQQMLDMMDQGIDVVYGQRRQRSGETIFKKTTAAVFYRMIQKLTDVPIPADTGDFRLISRRALNVLLQMPERHRFIRGMVSWIGFRQAPIMYDRDPRFAGDTKYPLRKMIRFAVDAVTSFSTRPLALATWAGLITACLSALLLIYVMGSWVFLDTQPGWTSVLTTVSLLGGVQLLVLGIIGEYLGRMYEQIKGRPLFVIEQIVCSGKAAGSSVPPDAYRMPSITAVPGRWSGESSQTQ